MSKFSRAAWLAAFSLGAAALAVGAGPASALEIAVRPALDSLGSGAALAVDLSGTLDDATVSGGSVAPAAVPAPVAAIDTGEDTPTTLAALVSQYADATPSDRQQECLAGAVYFESKSEPLEGQLAVAQVVLNRAQSGRFGGSVCGVVFQRNQFSFAHGGSMPAIARGSAAWKRAVAVADIAMNERWKPIAPKSLYFHAARVSPHWPSAVRVASIGNHIFYR